MKEVKYLRLIIAKGDIRMNSVKISAIVNWKALTCIKDIQSFLGFVNFYQRFIKGFSQLVSSLTVLTCKNIKFNWTATEKQAFQTLKTAFSSASILVMFNSDKLFTVKSDSSDCVTDEVLSQSDS